MKKKFLLSGILVVMICMFIFTANVNANSITDFYTVIDQASNKPRNSSPAIWTVDDTNFESILNGNIFKKGDQIRFNSRLIETGPNSPNQQWEGFMITDGNGGPNVTGTLATVNKASTFDNSIAQTITFTSDEPIILHSVGTGGLGAPVNNVGHRAFYIRYGKYEQYYPIEYHNPTGATLQYGGAQIDKAYITDDFYVIKFYDSYAKEGYHFDGVGIYSQIGQSFESEWLDPNTSPSSNGVTTLKTRIKKSYTDGSIIPGKMIVDISMTSGYTLKLDANGGKIDYLDSKIFEIESKYSDIKTSDYNTPVREGYTFGGWYTDSACAKPALTITDFGNEMDASRIEENAMNMTYYARWIPNGAFTITKSNTENGTFTVDKTAAAKGETVTITATPNDGYKVKSVKVNNSQTGITASGTNYTFKMPENNVTVSVEFELKNTEIGTKKTIDKTEENVTVSVTGTFTGNPVLAIEETKTGNDGYNSLITLVKDNKVVIGSYDVSITGGTYTGNLELKFTVGKQYEGDKVSIYHKKASGDIETFEATVKDGKIVITVSELSPFMLVTDKEVVAKKDETPKTGIATYMGITIFVTGVAVAGIITIKKKKFN